VGGTSLLSIGRTFSVKFDIVGVLQRITPPDYVNFGNRTILDRVNQLLPGEMKIPTQDMGEVTEFDNSLFSTTTKGNIYEQAELLWEVIKSDIKSCVQDIDKVNIGMSGGWDSRLIAGGLEPENKKTVCWTYGMFPDEYEVKISRKCAELLNADFIFCDIYEKYFPSRSDFTKNLSIGEGTFITPWLSVLDECKSSNQNVILLGDMFETLVGRNIKIFTTPKSRQQRFLRPSLTAKLLQKNDEVNFDKKANCIIDNILGSQLKQLKNLNMEYFSPIEYAEIVDILAEDLEKNKRRIQAFNIPTTTLNEEVWRWYTHGRSMARQFLCLKRKYLPLAPTMGIQSLKKTFSIEPILRADNKLLHEIQKHPDFKRFATVPSTAIPYIPSSYPLVIKNLGWGLRAKYDRKRINQMMEFKSGFANYRMVKSINHIQLYKHPKATHRVREWFSDGFYDGKHLIELISARANLLERPLVNTDIVGPASTVILMALILRG
jgi:hypothetical protein